MTTPTDPVWDAVRREAAASAADEPLLASFLHMTVLRHRTLEAVLSFHLSTKLATSVMDSRALMELIDEALQQDNTLRAAMRADMEACYVRDPACDAYSTPLLYYKGFHALQAYRVTHWLWGQGRKTLALFLQNRISEVMGVDIHPAAQIGCGVMLDHATGFVVGENRRDWRQCVDPARRHPGRHWQGMRRPPPQNRQRRADWCQRHRAGQYPRGRRGENWRGQRGAQPGAGTRHRGRRTGQSGRQYRPRRPGAEHGPAL